LDGWTNTAFYFEFHFIRVKIKGAMKMTAILVSKHHPGVVSMARNLAEVTGAVKVHYIEDLFNSELLFRLERRFFPHSFFSFTRSGIEKLVKEYDDRIILGGWSSIHEKIVNILNARGVKPSVMWCSTLGQMEMTCRMGDYKALVSLLSLNKEGKIRYILFNERLFEEMGFIENSIYFPHTLNLDKFNAYFKPYPQNNSDAFNIDLFVAMRSGKNILAQISAIKLSKYMSKIKLHINFKHTYIEQVITHWDVPVIKHNWLKWEEYLNLISGMHLSLQVTHTESFNYAVAERMAMGVPSLVSCNIYNVCKDEFLRKYLCVEAVDSPAKIRERMDFILANPSLFLDLRQKVHERINRVMREKNSLAAMLLNKLFYERP